jgi:Transcriptional regulator, AbiEi antitoxin, Type IV TA system
MYFQHLLKVLQKMKIPDFADLETKAEQSLLACLQDIPFLKVLSIERSAIDTEADFLVHIDSAGEETSLAIEVKNNGQPRIARAAINHLHRLKSLLPKAHPVFIAPYISPETAVLCHQENVSYLDLANNCHISFDRTYIHREGCPNPFKQSRSLRSIFSPKSERILRTLLCFPGKSWKMQELASLSQVSLGQVANVKKELLDREWAIESISGLQLNNLKNLLHEWATKYRYKSHCFHEFYSMRPLPELEASLATICIERNCQYAFTGFSGAIRLAPFVRYSKATAYIAGHLQAIIEELQIKPVKSGANLTLIVPNDDAVFIGSQSIDGMTVAAPMQLYLDLLSMPGRGEEAAEKILEEVIYSQWY